MNHAAAALELTDGERETLKRLAKSRTASARLVERAQVLLWASEGLANARIAEKAGVMPDSVRSWRAQYAADGLAQFAAVQPGRGRKPSIPA